MAAGASTYSSARPDLFFQASAAGPAEVEGGGILLAAAGAGKGRAGHGGAQVFVDEAARALGVGGVVDPDLRKGRLDGQLAREARGVRVEDARANAAIREQIREEVRLRQICRGVNAFQKR